MTHICVNRLTNIGSDNGFANDRRQAIILTNAGILFIEPLGTNIEEIIHENAFENVVCKMPAILSLPECVNDDAQMQQDATLYHLYHHISHSNAS